MIIEDEPEFLELLELVLSSVGYETASCENGREALNRIKEEAPDLIILDVMLPGMDGHAIARQLAMDEETNRIPIIVMTALEQSKRLFDGLDQVKAFCSKLINPTDFLEKVQEVLNASSPGAV